MTRELVKTQKKVKVDGAVKNWLENHVPIPWEY